MCDQVPSVIDLNCDCLQLICDYLTIEEFINFSVACGSVVKFANDGVINSRKILYVFDDGREAKILTTVRKYNLHKCLKRVYFYTDGRRSYKGFLEEFLSHCINLSHLTIAFTSFIHINMPPFHNLVYLQLRSVFLQNRHLLTLTSLKESLQHLVMMFIGGDLDMGFLLEFVNLRSLCIWMNVCDGRMIAAALNNMRQLRAVDIRHYCPDIQSEDLYFTNQSVVLRAIASLAKLEEYVCYYVEDKMDQYLHILRAPNALTRFSLVVESCAREDVQLIRYLCKMECVRIVGWYNESACCEFIGTCLPDVQCLWLQNYNKYLCGCCSQHTTTFQNLTKLHTLYYVQDVDNDYDKLLCIIAGLSSSVSTVYVFLEFSNELCNIFPLVSALHSLNLQRNTMLNLYLVNSFGGYGYGYVSRIIFFLLNPLLIIFFRKLLMYVPRKVKK